MSSLEDTIKTQSKNLSLWKNRLSRTTGAALGLSLGLVGPLHPIGIFLIVLLLLFRCKLSWAIVAAMVGFASSMVVDTSPLGLAILEMETLKSFWTLLYNTPIIALSGFNETRAMGGLTLGLLLMPLIFLALFLFDLKRLKAKASKGDVL